MAIIYLEIKLDLIIAANESCLCDGIGKSDCHAVKVLQF